MTYLSFSPFLPVTVLAITGHVASVELVRQRRQGLACLLFAPTPIVTLAGAILLQGAFLPG